MKDLAIEVEPSWGSWIYDWAVTAVDCGINLSGAGAIAQATGVFFGNFYGYYSSFDKCRPKVKEKNISQVTSIDPNAKEGPAGYTDYNYISYPDEILYSVYFENQASASAPAQTVTITDSLDMNVFDISTFRFGPVQFDTVNEALYVGYAHEFVRYIDLRPSKDIILKIEGVIDTISGVVRWDFTSLDPMTAELTEDPLGGFLPPNVNYPEGEGSVSFFINPLSGLSNDTQIKNKATIVFDVNPPIATDLFSNKLDILAPVCTLDNHSIINDSTVVISWSGTDANSGIRDFSLYVSEDDSTYKAISFGNGETSTTFIGELGKTYYFYMSATDSVGNEQQKPLTPDLTLTFTPSSSENIKDEHGNILLFPIPVENTLTMNVSNPQNAEISVIVYDLNGKIVYEKIYFNEFNKIDLSKLNTGMYFVKIIIENEVAIYKIIKS